MNKIKLIFTLTLFSFLTSNAQITKGNWMMGGNIGFDYSKRDNKNNTSGGTVITTNDQGAFLISLEPNIAYFIRNKFAIGTSISYVNGFIEGTKINSDGMNLGINPFLRYYFLDAEKDYNIFLEPSYNQFISKGLGNGNGFSLKTGFSYFLNSSVAIETILKYFKSSNDDFNSNKIYFGFGFQIHLEKE